jgi:hypothetical protein
MTEEQQPTGRLAKMRADGKRSSTLGSLLGLLFRQTENNRQNIIS